MRKSKSAILEAVEEIAKGLHKAGVMDRVRKEAVTIRSPFAGLRIPKELVCEFFAVFSRFEFALKEAGFVQGENRVSADWDCFAKEAATWVKIEPTLRRRLNVSPAIRLKSREPT